MSTTASSANGKEGDPNDHFQVNIPKILALGRAMKSLGSEPDYDGKEDDLNILLVLLEENTK